MGNLTSKLATLRMIRALTKMHFADVLDYQNDPILQEWWSPVTSIYKELIDDPDLPQEVRKALNAPRAEL